MTTSFLKYYLDHILILWSDAIMRTNEIRSSMSSLTRRSMMTATTTTGFLTFCGLPSPANAAPADRISRTAESIHQEPVFRATRERVYQALTDGSRFAQVVQESAAVKSGMKLGNKPVEISKQVGGTFTLYGGHIIGRH